MIVTKKRIMKFLEETCVVENKDGYGHYYTKEGHYYLTMVGMEEHIKFMLKHGITEQLQSAHAERDHTVAVGYNPKEKKWYGWSHRAIYGFTIGSECKKGHCHYHPKNKEDFYEDSIRFWSDPHKTNVRISEKKEDGCQVEWDYDNKLPNEDLRGTIGGVWCEFPEKWGRGEWVAQTMEDAKQMAIDFAKGVG